MRARLGASRGPAPGCAVRKPVPFDPTQRGAQWPLVLKLSPR